MNRAGGCILFVTLLYDLCDGLTSLGLFFVYFWSFQTNISIFTANIFENCPFSIRCQDLNSRPSDYESPRLTARPGLPPMVPDSSFAHWRCLDYEVHHSIINGHSPASFCLFSFFSNKVQIKTVDFSGIQTRIVRVGWGWTLWPLEHKDRPWTRSYKHYTA